jgi:hypothetical protein
VLIAVIYALALLPWGAGLFIAIPLMVISNYTGYKAMFKEDEPVAPSVPAPPAPPTLQYIWNIGLREGACRLD